MKRPMGVLTLAGVAALLTGSVVAPAIAAPPERVHTKLNDTMKGIDQCGLTVDSYIRGTDMFKTWVDKSGNVHHQDTAHVVSTLTNPANGKVVHVDNAGRDVWSESGVVNPDGTVTFTDVLTGRDIRVYTSHSNVLLKDVGYLAIVTTTDADGNVLDQQLVEHGPHAFAGDFDAFCAAITSAIG